MKFTWVADPQISRSAERIAFVRVTVNEKDNKYESSIYMIAGTSGESAARPLTSGKHDLSPRWSPDDKWLAFVRPDEKDTPQIWVLPIGGGEAHALTDLPKGAGSPVWSPDGKWIAFTSTTTADDLKKPDPAAKPERKSDVKVVTRAVYRANGNPTYVDADRHAHIWTVAVNERAEKSDPKQITSGDFDERGAQWAPDGTSLYFVSDRIAESYYGPGDTDIYKVSASGGEIAKVVSIDGQIATFSLSPDGKRIAFVGSASQPVRWYSQPDLWVADATPGSTAKNLTADYDFDILGGIGGDQAAPRGENPKPIVWWKDEQADALIVTAAEHGSSNLKRVSIPTGKVEPLTEGTHDIGAYTISRNGTIATIVSTQTTIGDIGIATTNRAQAARNNGTSPLGMITHVNDALFNEMTQSEPEEIWYTSFDGKKIQGWILQAARLRPVEEVSADPRNPRRAALGVRQRLHARIPVDGGEGLRRALHQSARQHDLRPGLRQHHPVPLSRRRLQGPDGRRRRSGEARLRRSRSGSASPAAAAAAC